MKDFEVIAKRFTVGMKAFEVIVKGFTVGMKAFEVTVKGFAVGMNAFEVRWKPLPVGRLERPAPKGRQHRAWGVSPRKGSTRHPSAPKGRQQTGGRSRRNRCAIRLSGRGGRPASVGSGQTMAEAGLRSRDGRDGLAIKI
jgi:hypothetical protein